MIAWKSESELHTVLIISTDVEMVSVWETLFKQKNCHVINETDPYTALQTAHLLCPSLIVLHLDMPERELISLCRELRASTNGTLLLLAPSVDHNQNVFEYYQAGVDEHIITPISPMALLIKSMAWLVKQEWTSLPMQKLQIQA